MGISNNCLCMALIILARSFESKATVITFPSFREADADQNGCLSPEEYETLIQRLSETPPTETSRTPTPIITSNEQNTSKFTIHLAHFPAELPRSAEATRVFQAVSGSDVMRLSRNLRENSTTSNSTGLADAFEQVDTAVLYRETQVDEAETFYAYLSSPESEPFSNFTTYGNVSVEEGSTITITTPPPLPPPASPSEPAFRVRYGNCTAPDDGLCIASPEYPSQYPPDSNCSFEVLREGTLSVVSFELENPNADSNCYDWFLMDDLGYCGTYATSLEGSPVSPDTRLAFRSDNIYQLSGFKICWSEYTPPPPMTPDSPLQPPSPPVPPPTPPAVIDDQDNSFDLLQAAVEDTSVNEVVLQVDVTITQNLPTIARSLHILGECVNGTYGRCTIDGVSTFRLFTFEGEGDQPKNLRIQLENLLLVRGNYGALNCKGMTITLLNCEVSESGGALGGGALFLNNCPADMTDVALYRNQAEIYGGAIYGMQYSTLTLRGAVFEGNIALYGGAIFLSAYTTLTAWSCRFVANWAVYGGGAIAQQGASRLYAYVCELRDNLVDEYQVQNLLQSSYVNNAEYMTLSPAGGGAILAQDFSYVFILEGSAVNNNTCSYRTGATDEGGGGIAGGRNTEIQVMDASDVSYNRIFLSCCGGGILATGAEAKVILDGASRVHGNSGFYGAGISDSSGPVHIYIQGNSTVSGNVGSTGGGICIWSVSGTMVVTQGSVIKDNTASSTGGGLHLAVGTTFIMEQGAKIIHNSAITDGGGVYLGVSCVATVSEGASVEHNRAEVDGGGFWLEKSARLSLFSSTVSSNYA
ncbi:hypothetical protein CYMTET_26841, partial [Cymbomonas tetramitiformis]